MNTPKQTTKSPWRRRILLFLIGISSGSLLAMHFLPGDILQEILREESTLMGLHMSETHSCTLSLITDHGSINGIHVFIADRSDAIYSCENMQFNPGLLSILFGSRSVIEDLQLLNVQVNLRRNADGKIPIPLIDITANSPWSALGKHLSDWARTYAQRKAESQDNNSHAGAIIKNLHLSGGSILLPDASELDVESFSIDGSNLSSQLQDHEEMRIVLHLRCIGTRAKSTILHCEFTHSNNKTAIDVSLKNFPSSMLSKSYLGVESLAQLRPQGLIDLHFTHSTHHAHHTHSNKNKTTINGSLQLSSQQLTLNPEPHVHPVMHNIAQRLQDLRDHSHNAPVNWQLSYHGQPNNIAINYHINEVFQDLIALREQQGE